MKRTQRRIQAGHTQIQATKNSSSLRYAGEKIPSCAYKQFTAMLKDSRDDVQSIEYHKLTFRVETFSFKVFTSGSYAVTLVPFTFLQY